MMKKETWGSLYDRYSNKNVPRKILSIDGGGIRGVVALGILAELEKQLREMSGRAGFRLVDYFDFIGGTSTGAIIAAGLAIGKSVEEIQHLYMNKGKEMFEKRMIAGRLRSIYKSSNLQKQLKQLFGESRDITPDNLMGLLMVVLMNTDTDSPWPISSNPDAKYNDLAHPECNLKIPLWKLVRASAAAPLYFSDEKIQLNEIDPETEYAFVDGGVTPHNNPSWVMYRMATHPAYNMNWTRGEKNLLIVSVGTGQFENPGRYKNITKLVDLPGNLLNTMKIEKDINCRQFGRCTWGSVIDSELGDMIPPKPENGDSGKDFLYVRYDAELSQDWINENNLHHIDEEDVQKIDSIDKIQELWQIGLVAGKYVNAKEHFESFFSEASIWPPFH